MTKSILRSTFFLQRKAQSPIWNLWKRIIHLEKGFFICNVMFDSIKCEFLFSFYSISTFRRFYFKINQQLMSVYFNILTRRDAPVGPPTKSLKRLISPTFLNKLLSRFRLGKSANYFWSEFLEKRFVWKEFFSFAFRRRQVGLNRQSVKVLIFSKHSTSLCPTRPVRLSPGQLAASTFVLLVYDYARRKYAKWVLGWRQVLQMSPSSARPGSSVNAVFLSSVARALADRVLEKLKPLVATVFERIR